VVIFGVAIFLRIMVFIRASSANQVGWRTRTLGSSLGTLPAFCGNDRRAVYRPNAGWIHYNLLISFEQLNRQRNRAGSVDLPCCTRIRLDVSGQP
jgi:hypothetical protein